MSISGSTVTLVSNTTPDHKSPYWGSRSANYEAPHSGMQVNPHSIATQNITFRITTTPAAAMSWPLPMMRFDLGFQDAPLTSEATAAGSSVSSPKKLCR